ncbi:hypothetical protein L1987_58527 [Smallanthus sonchifolius]|uniref:Uncharacterized protein n=1 Tax=Smallanthus sonchifolius TaxID=185202 RepID=A0ACB9DG07_9ASTR|nr:hypothetical protein L1987_58527 [Smallanthus sonchifolius]
MDTYWVEEALGFLGSISSLANSRVSWWWAGHSIRLVGLVDYVPNHNGFVVGLNHGNNLNGMSLLGLFVSLGLYNLTRLRLTDLVWALAIGRSYQLVVANLFDCGLGFAWAYLSFIEIPAVQSLEIAATAHLKTVNLMGFGLDGLKHGNELAKVWVGKLIGLCILDHTVEDFGLGLDRLDR